VTDRVTLHEGDCLAVMRGMILIDAMVPGCTTQRVDNLPAAPSAPPGARVH